VWKKTRIIVCGGREPATADEQATCEVLDLRNKASGWKALAPMYIPHRYTTGVLLPDDNTFIVTGGYVSSAPYSAYIFYCEKYNITANTWYMIANMSTIRGGHASVLYQNKVVVLGGDCKEVEVYDETQKRWRSDLIPQMSTVQRHYLSAVSF
jgi:hypothetical protein